jgi:hypothetical protein
MLLSKGICDSVRRNEGHVRTHSVKKTGVHAYLTLPDLVVNTLPTSAYDKLSISSLLLGHSAFSEALRAHVNELGLQIDAVLPWFVIEQTQQYTRVAVPAEHAAMWDNVLRDAVRRCYISDAQLAARAEATGSTPAEILATVLPDAGAVMSGDFGEIVGYIYLASREQVVAAVGPKRWRLKQDRTKPAPYSDIVQLILPQWPQASANDRLICGEVKAKATASAFRPIEGAIAGSLKDSTSRLSRSLVWLRERSLLGGIGIVTMEQLNRFINATEYPPYIRQFHAIAVGCSNLVQDELATFVPENIPAGCALVVISIPNLRNTYTTIYEAVQHSVEAGEVAEPLA